MFMLQMLEQASSKTQFLKVMLWGGKRLMPMADCKAMKPHFSRANIGTCCLVTGKQLKSVRAMLQVKIWIKDS